MTMIVGCRSRVLTLFFLFLIVCMILSRFAAAMTTTTTKPITTQTTSSSSARTATKPRLVFHWFRNDLRVHDNPALVHSSKHGDVCVPVFCFDAKLYGNAARTQEPFGSLKWGPKRAKFLLESVDDLRSQLRAIGSDLVVAHGDLAAIFEDFIRIVRDSYHVSVVCQEEPLQEEREAVQQVQRILQTYHQNEDDNNNNNKRQEGDGGCVTTVWGSTLYELSDLPFEQGTPHGGGGGGGRLLLDNMPDVFTPFRTKVEKACQIHSPLPVPNNKNRLQFLSKDSSQYQALESSLSFLPSLKDLGYTDEQIAHAHEIDPRGAFLEFIGGETRAIQRLRSYIWDDVQNLQTYFDTRNSMLGANTSSKFSPWLALGCVSPRRIALECRNYEQQVIQNKSTYWLVFELLWRDYCKFFCVKHGDKIFSANGIVSQGQQHRSWSTSSTKDGSSDSKFVAWKEGKTGYPLVDANMRELQATGWMSNRGRQNVCSFLALDLNHDWRYGADWFESQLLDYDVYSNWFNWCAGAGMTGGRINRFNIVKQSKDYDQHGDYVRLWIPELGNVPTEFVHEPWKMTKLHQLQYNVQLGTDYPLPIVRPTSTSGGGGGGGGGPRRGGENESKNKQRKPNKSGGNRHQKYEMKSVKVGQFELK